MLFCKNAVMKKYLVLLMVMLLPMATVQGKKKEKQNIMVWGEVTTAADGKDYLTMYKNCPAEVTAQFHFVYKDKTKSIMYDLFMPDTVAQVNDPAPVEKPVKEVVIDNIIYSTLDAEGKKYSTSDPDDPILAMVLVDLFDIYHDIFWFDVIHRAHYYNGRSYDRWTPSSTRYNNTHHTKKPEISIDKLDDTALLVGAAAVAVASAGMLYEVFDKWDVEDGRFPYFSMSPQMEYFTNTGALRDVVQFKYRFGQYGGFSVLGDIGYCSGSLNDRNMFDPGFTWSLGVGLDVGAFSLSFRGKPGQYRHSENFLTCKAVYDIFITDNFAIDLGAGVCIRKYNDDIYGDIPISLGLIWKF
jgi:hypothetical protein